MSALGISTVTSSAEATGRPPDRRTGPPIVTTQSLCPRRQRKSADLSSRRMEAPAFAWADSARRSAHPIGTGRVRNQSTATAPRPPAIHRPRETRRQRKGLSIEKAFGGVGGAGSLLAGPGAPAGPAATRYQRQAEFRPVPQELKDGPVS